MSLVTGLSWPNTKIDRIGSFFSTCLDLNAFVGYCHLFGAPDTLDFMRHNEEQERMERRRKLDKEKKMRRSMVGHNLKIENTYV